MKRIGLVGGMSWESSIEYYRLLNEAVRRRRGGLQSANCVLRSLDFARIEWLQRNGRWREVARIIVDEAVVLVGGGADLLLLCSNTLHEVADEVERSIHVPFLHIVDATALAVRAAGLSRVGLLGSAYTTAEDGFYVERLRLRHGLDVMVPSRDERDLLHDLVYRELCAGIFTRDAWSECRRVIATLEARGAECIVLASTELGLLVGREDAAVPVFDTVRVHAEAAVELALADDTAEPAPAARGLHLA